MPLNLSTANLNRFKFRGLDNTNWLLIVDETNKKLIIQNDDGDQDLIDDLLHIYNATPAIRELRKRFKMSSEDQQTTSTMDIDNINDDNTSNESTIETE